MAEKKASWDDIPSLEGLAVDWGYEPVNSLGKRAHVRMKGTELCPVLDVKTIPVKIVASDLEKKGYLIDLTPAGMAVRLDCRLEINKPIMVGLFLGEQKIVSKGIVKNVKAVGGRFKTGILFEKIDKEYEEFIAGLFASRILDF